jgi:hypothetical protein
MKLTIKDALEIVHRRANGENLNLTLNDLNIIYQTLGYNRHIESMNEMPPAYYLNLTGGEAMDYEIDRVRFDTNKRKW